MAISNTRLSLFKRCRLKYHWNYSKSGAPPSSSRGLRRGSSGHLALASYYRGEGIANAIATAWEDFSPSCERSLEDMLDLDYYLDRYFKWVRNQDRWKVLEVETTVEVEFGGEKLMGIWDLLVEVNGKKFIVDHKFQKSQSFGHLDVDSQVTHYLTLSQLARVNVHGMIYNIINLQKGDKSPAAYRKIATRSPEFIDAYLESLVPTIQEIRQLDDGELPIYPNWTKDCSWDCGFYKRCIEKPFRIEDSNGKANS